MSHAAKAWGLEGLHPLPRPLLGIVVGFSCWGLVVCENYYCSFSEHRDAHLQPCCQGERLPEADHAIRLALWEQQSRHRRPGQEAGAQRCTGAKEKGKDLTFAMIRTRNIVAYNFFKFLLTWIQAFVKNWTQFWGGALTKSRSSREIGNGVV